MKYAPEKTDDYEIESLKAQGHQVDEKLDGMLGMLKSGSSFSRHDRACSANESVERTPVRKVSCLTALIYI